MNNRTILVFIAAFGISGALLAQAPAAATRPSSATRAGAQARRPSSGGKGIVEGVVKDDTGGVIPNAAITLTDSATGATTTAITGADGNYTFRGVAPGTYTVSATFKGLQQNGAVLISVANGQPTPGNIVMVPETQKEEVTVSESTNTEVSTDPANNVGAIVLKKEDLDALPDDPDDLQADLTALAGPSAGPGGNQIYIDGFTGGQLPPKSSIREIRINSNPFSAEFDKLGFGRIQIFTKPGTDKFHGQGMYDISDDIWNSRNPFLTVNPPFRSQIYGGNVSGPLGKKASFFIDLQRRQIDDNGIIVASIVPYALNNNILAPNAFGIQPYNTFQPTPQRRFQITPRLDWQLTQNNTLSARYEFLVNDLALTGVSGFSLPSAGYGQSTTEETAQVVDTDVVNTHVVNETHFQYDRERTTETSINSAPTIDVANSFVQNGGSGFGNSYDLEQNYELQNYTSVTWGPHVTKFGLRVRANVIGDSSEKGFGGEYIFGGGSAYGIQNGLSTGQKEQVTSIQQYATLEMLLNQYNYTLHDAALLGYGPTRFQQNHGIPYLGVHQIDYGPFVQDDWRVKPNLTLSLGLRFESQTNISDKADWAPRVAFAWSPDNKGGRGAAKTVIRGGFGMFYDRFAVGNVLEAERFGLSSNQVSYVVNSPALVMCPNGNFPSPADPTCPGFPNAPSPSTLQLSTSNTSTYVIDSHFQAPYLMQTAFGLERQIAKRITASVNYTNSRGNHLPMTVDINAPYLSAADFPATAAANGALVGQRPNPALGNIYDYESVGIYRQNQLMISLNAQIRNLTLFTRYSFQHANSDTDGLGTQPADPYNIGAEYGRTTTDIHHFMFIGGSYTMKWNMRLSPFIIIRSGAPFDITTGTDLYETNAFTARPGIASGPGPGIVSTPYGYLDPIPQVGQPILERNAGNGPGYVGINLRLSKTWGFGTTKFQGSVGGAHAGGGGGRGGRGGGGFGGGGPRGMGDVLTEHRFNITLSANMRNILNHANLNTPNGSMTSPYFLQSLGITGGFSAEQTSSEQRRMDIQLRFAF
jgi:Carboxypeptidase regulatory-like domain